jgi:hypothetical protein
MNYFVFNNRISFIEWLGELSKYRKNGYSRGETNFSVCIVQQLLDCLQELVREEQLVDKYEIVIGSGLGYVFREEFVL